ncbi:intracellular protein transport protein USO1-like [Nicotiana sylvestris]|uniref:intracellular protein transport protein USO1-like n=1 Tax=Nicotiana sylvestris TaxID=4096 RepID=UPI00388CC909
MAAPPNFEEGQSTYRPPRFNGQYYGWWKTRIHNFIMAEDSELWDVICDGPYVPTKKVGYPPVTMSKTRKEYNDANRRTMEKNFRAKKILVCGIGPDEYKRISACQSAKEIWKALNKLVRKILSVLPSSWESKVNAITEAKDLQALTIDKLVGNIKTYEMKKKKDSERREPKKEKNLLFKAEGNESSEEDSKRNPVPDKCFKRKNVANNIVKQALVTWGDSSSESEEETDAGGRSMMVVESEANEYDSIFALMAHSDNDEDDEVNYRDVQRNQKSYSPKNSYDKDYLTIELGDVEQIRDDLVVCVVALKETIDNLENEKKVLIEKITSVEHERDDLVVTVVDLKETIENFSKEKDASVEKVTVIEQERDDLLIVIVDLREIIEELGAECRLRNSEKGKRQLQAELKRVKNDLEKSLKWTWSSEVITSMDPNLLGFLNLTCDLIVEGTTKGSSQQWFMDSGYSKHMTENTMDFLSLKALQGRSVSFGNGKKGGDLSYLKAVDDDAELWHKRLGHASFSLLNKLIQKDLVRGLPMSKFKEHKWIAKNFWAEAINTACYLVNKCMIGSLLNKTPYELLNGRKPKLTHLRIFECKCYVLNNGKDQLGKFDAKSDEGIFLGYSSQTKAYKIYNKRTQYVEESVHVIFGESYPSCEKINKDDQDREPLLVTSEVIDMTNGKADMMSQVKEPSEANAVSSSPARDEPGVDT